MDTKKPTAFAQNVMWCGLIVAGLWVVVPLLDMLRVGLGNPLGRQYFSEAMGRALASFIGLGAVAWLLEKIEKITGAKTAPPP